MKNKIKTIFVLIGLLLGSSALSVLATDWVAPVSAPPTCVSGNPGCDAPINTSSSAQSKAGSLAIGKSTSPLTTLDVNGNIGSVGLLATNLTIGTPTYIGTLQFVDGHQAAGKVLTSDANGSATWNTPVTSGPVYITPNSLSVIFYSISDITTDVGWFTADATTSGVPAGAKAVILEAESSLNGPNCNVTIDSSNPEGGACLAKILIRKDASSPSLLLQSMASAGGGDWPAWSNQGVFPLTSTGSFQWKIKVPSSIASTDRFNTRIRIIGYYP